MISNIMFLTKLNLLYHEYWLLKNGTYIFCGLFYKIGNNGSCTQVESFIIDRTELDEDPRLEKSKFLLSPDETDRSVDPETQARLEALLHAAGTASEF